MKYKIAYLGMFAAVAVLLGYVETLFPVFTGVPGVKLGLANLVSLWLLWDFGIKEAGFVAAVRIFIIGFMFGSLFSICYSLAGSAVSLIIMNLAKKQRFSIMGASIAGGVSHNLGQLAVACIIVENLSLAVYLPVLLAAGAITGTVIGILVMQVKKRIGKWKIV